MTPFPELTDMQRLERLQPRPGKLSIVLDTDTYNEVDDQFALEAIYAAPFHNARSDGPEDGMERSYDEILRLLNFMGHSADGLVFKGSTHYLEADTAEASPAVYDLIKRALAQPEGDPLYVVAIAAITNIANARTRVQPLSRCACGSGAV